VTGALGAGKLNRSAWQMVLPGWFESRILMGCALKQKVVKHLLTVVT
jgi:hypothetical protein